MNIIRTALSTVPGNWCKFQLTNSEGKHCGIGHVIMAYDPMVHGNLGSHDAVVEMVKVAKEQYPERLSEDYPVYTDFNDHPDTTEADVIAVMEKAAVRLDERL